MRLFLKNIDIDLMISSFFHHPWLFTTRFATGHAMEKILMHFVVEEKQFYIKKCFLKKSQLSQDHM